MFTQLRTRVLALSWQVINILLGAGVPWFFANSAAQEVHVAGHVNIRCTSYFVGVAVSLAPSLSTFI